MFRSQPNIPNPWAKALTVTPELHAQISKYLATTYDVQIGKKLALELIPNTLLQWGQMQITQGGNLIQAQGYHKLQWDGCNTSFVWYELLANQLAHLPRATPNFVPTSYYGQLQYLFKLPLKPKSVVNPSKDGSKYLILVFILEAPVVIEDAYEYRVTWYKGKLGSGEVVNALTIQCAVGRIQDNKRWWITVYTCYALDEQSPGNPTLIHASDPSAQIQTPQISPTPDKECKSDPGHESGPSENVRPLTNPKTRPPSRNPTPREIPTPGDYRHPTLKKKSDPRGGSDLKSRTPAEITPRRRGPVFPSVRPPGLNSPYLLGTRWVAGSSDSEVQAMRAGALEPHTTAGSTIWNPNDCDSSDEDADLASPVATGQRNVRGGQTEGAPAGREPTLSGDESEDSGDETDGNGAVGLVDVIMKTAGGASKSDESDESDKEKEIDGDKKAGKKKQDEEDEEDKSKEDNGGE
ncbi:hypothetical protein RHS01_10136 [Rhizoctonia solani]|uniref:Uncharacterized protein n=1 Tax=Rhizoctonia solani TaxID=456999 RepID=A0A8H7I443_9AGAM|nr:hypothetical protein RHS01_10136 [Rhizoctonia solani]